MASLQVESGGRAVLVLGRGDSAVLQLGLRPATTARLASRDATPELVVESNRRFTDHVLPRLRR